VTAPGTAPAPATHWDRVHGGDERERSWFREDPGPSFRLVHDAASGPDAPVIDVGAGTSRLVDRLLAAGHTDVTVLDVSATALARLSERLGPDPRVTAVIDDVRDWRPDRTYDVWHDRATFHFLVDDAEAAAYVASARTAVREGGHAVIATFAPDAPETCSALPVRRRDAAALAEAFGSAFELVHDEREEHRTPGGALQPFTWVVLRRTAS
jgi:SAM-dependent methyltransferase